MPACLFYLIRQLADRPFVWLSLSLDVLQYVSFFNYLNVALQKNEFHGLTFAPTTPTQPPLTGSTHPLLRPEDIAAAIGLLPTCQGHKEAFKDRPFIAP